MSQPTENHFSAPPHTDDIYTLRTQRLVDILDPASAALLIIDLQNDFLSPEGKSATAWHQNISGMQTILPAIEAVTRLFYDKQRPILRTVTYEDPEFRTEAGLDRFLWFENNNRESDVACLKGSWGADLYVAAKQSDIVIEKTRVSAYVGTKLHDIIMENSIKTLCVVGIKTQRCVARTVQDLYENEPALHVVTLEDCIASDDMSQHDATVTELKNFYPPVITSTQLIDAWSTP